MGRGRSEKGCGCPGGEQPACFSAQRVGTWTCLYPSAATPKVSPLPHSCPTLLSTRHLKAHPCLKGARDQPCVFPPMEYLAPCWAHWG